MEIEKMKNPENDPKQTRGDIAVADQQKQVRRRRGRPVLPPDQKNDPKAKRTFYQPLEDYELFFAFCQGDISRELPRLQALWMAISADMKAVVSEIVVKDKPLAKAVEDLKKVLPDLLLDEALGTYIADLPRDKKMAILSGQPVSLPVGGAKKERRARSR